MSDDDHLELALDCPVCSAPLSVWRLDGSTLAPPTVSLGYRGSAEHRVHGCMKCGGAWVFQSTLDQMIQSAVHAHASDRSNDPRAAEQARRQLVVEPVVYRRCPRCDQMMHRRNFGRVSGVVVDECRTCGTWFDAGEFEAVLEFVRAGGLSLTERHEREEARRDAEARSRPTTIDFERGGWMVDERRRSGRVGGLELDLLDLLADLVSGIRRLVRTIWRWMAG